MKNLLNTRVATCVAALCIVSGALGADHRDGSIQQDQPADIADTYAFVNPNNTSNVVLGLTVNGFTVPGVAADFSTDVLYQIKIDNDGDFVEDLVFQARYTGLGAAQTLTLMGPTKPSRTGALNRDLPKARGRGRSRVEAPTFVGASDGTVQDASALLLGMRVFSGRADDPFFVDLIYVRSVLGVIPALEREPGTDLFAGLNVSALMIEVPIVSLKGESNTINVWSTASRQSSTRRSPRRDEKSRGPWVQVDREGLPAINATLIAPADRDAYNRGAPKDDEKYVAPVAAAIFSLGALSQSEADGLAGALLPDVLALDTTSTAGFLNGRRPQDDVIDGILGLLTNNGLTSDGVDKNDSTGDGINSETGFPDAFPFLGPEHAPSEVIPSRD